MADSREKDSADRVRVGHVAGAHGIRGDVVIKSYTDIPEDIAAYGPLYTQHDTTLSIRKCRVASKGVIAFIDGVTNRNAAEALKGTQLFVDRNAFPETDDDEWYVTDLVGLNAHDESDAVVGTVLAVHDFGAGELLELDLEQCKQTILLPFTRENVPNVCVAEGYVTVHITPDLLGAEKDSVTVDSEVGA